MRSSPSPRDEIFKPRPALGKGPFAQILVAVGEEIVGAQMRGKFGDQFRRDAFAIEPLLQDVERLDTVVAHDQKLAVNGARKLQRFEEIRKAFGNILAGARIKPCGCFAVVPRRDSLHTDAVPFPFGHELCGIQIFKIGVVERVRQHRRPERRRIAARRFFTTPLEPGEQFAIRWRKPGPQQLDVLCILVAERSGGGFGKPRRDADTKSAGDELYQRPPAGLVERVEPARELLRQLCLAEHRQRFDHRSERQFFRLSAGRRDRRGPHQRDGLRQVADIVVG